MENTLNVLKATKKGLIDYYIFDANFHYIKIEANEKGAMVPYSIRYGETTGMPRSIIREEGLTALEYYAKKDIWRPAGSTEEKAGTDTLSVNGNSLWKKVSSYFGLKAAIKGDGINDGLFEKKYKPFSMNTALTLE